MSQPIQRECPRTEALVADVQVPEIDAQVVCRDIGFAIRVDRDRVDVVGMGVGVDFAWHGGDNGIVVSQLWQSERCARNGSMLSIAMVVLRDDFDGFLKHLPQLDSLV